MSVLTFLDLSRMVGLPTAEHSAPFKMARFDSSSVPVSKCSYCRTGRPKRRFLLFQSLSATKYVIFAKHS